MQIQFPRRIQLGLRPWYGLTLRQLAYLVIASVTAGAIVLFGPVEGSGLLVRVLIGLGVISIGVAIAFFRKDGLTAEQWIVTQIKFWSRPQKRVWTRGDDSTSPRDQVAEIAIDPPETMQSNPNSNGATYGIEQDGQGFSHVRLLHPTAQAVSATPAVVVLIDMAMLFSLFAFVLYLFRGGLGEIQGWFFLQMRR
jgi:phosphoribosyl-AMP cyclohydrolase